MAGEYLRHLLYPPAIEMPSEMLQSTKGVSTYLKRAPSATAPSIQNTFEMSAEPIYDQIFKCVFSGECGICAGVHRGARVKEFSYLQGTKMPDFHAFAGPLA